MRFVLDPLSSLPSLSSIIISTLLNLCVQKPLTLYLLALICSTWNLFGQLHWETCRLTWRKHEDEPFSSQYGQTLYINQIKFHLCLMHTLFEPLHWFDLHPEFSCTDLCWGGEHSQTHNSQWSRPHSCRRWLPQRSSPVNWLEILQHRNRWKFHRHCSFKCDQ